MCERGFSFTKIDLYRSSASEFIIDGNSLIPPFNAIPGLGTNAAYNIVKAREKENFFQKKTFKNEGRFQKRSWSSWISKDVWKHCQIKINFHCSNCIKNLDML